MADDFGPKTSESRLAPVLEVQSLKFDVLPPEVQSLMSEVLSPWKS